MQQLIRHIAHAQYDFKLIKSKQPLRFRYYYQDDTKRDQPPRHHVA